MTTKLTTPDPEVPSTVSINGVDYSLEDASSYIEKGKRTVELEKEWDTPVDKVWPEYGKTRESLKSMETQLNEAKAQLQEFQNKKEAGVETPTDVKEAQEAARKLGIVLNEDLGKQGYIKKEDLDQYLAEHDVQREEVRKVMEIGDSLAKEIDGSDGRPAFNKKAVLAYAAAYNISDLKEAYEDMNKTQLDSWKTKQVESKRASGLKTFSPGGVKQVREGKITDDNVGDLMRETLYGGSDAS